MGGGESERGHVCWFVCKCGEEQVRQEVVLACAGCED